MVMSLSIKQSPKELPTVEQKVVVVLWLAEEHEVAKCKELAGQTQDPWSQQG